VKKGIAFALFDTGETILGALVFSTSFPLYITQHVDPKVYSLTYGLAFLSSFLVALYLGKLADTHALRKPFFGLFSLLTAVLCASISLFYSSPLKALSFFLLMAVSHQQAFVFYNSLLLSFEGVGKVSGLGVAFGYVGSALALLLLAERLREPDLYLQVSLIFLVFSLPSLLFLDNPKLGGEVRIREVIRDKRFLLLIVSILCITEVANTLVAMMGVYLREVYSLQKEEIYRVIGVSALAGVLGGPLWGSLTDLLGIRKVFPLGFLLWAFFLLSLPFVPKESVLLAGFLAGLSLSHLWTTSRVLVLEEFPKGQSSVRLSFLSLSERVASTTGLSLWALFLFLTGDDFRLSASLMVLFPILGFIFYRLALK